MLFSRITASKSIITGLPADVESYNPIELLRNWYTTAQKAKIFMPDAMSLATSTNDGKPSARMVLLKGIEDDAIVFFTNYESRKAHELIQNPFAAVILCWVSLQRQIRIEGSVAKISREQSEAYFHSRPRGSQIGAWASLQSQPLDKREALEQREKELIKKYQGQTVPLPNYWGGFRIRIESIEFWQGRANRLHDRIRFTKNGENWQSLRLYP